MSKSSDGMPKSSRLTIESHKYETIESVASLNQVLSIVHQHVTQRSEVQDLNQTFFLKTLYLNF